MSEKMINGFLQATEERPKTAIARFKAVIVQALHYW
jgi:hypothetical protein